MRIRLESIAVSDQDHALRFYTETLGFVKKRDIPMGHGARFLTVVSPTVAEYFGLQAHGAIFGIVLFSGTIGGAAGPILAGRVFDLTGSYAPAFTALAVLASVGLALVLRLPSSTPRFGKEKA